MTILSQSMSCQQAAKLQSCEASNSQIHSHKSNNARFRDATRGTKLPVGLELAISGGEAWITLFALLNLDRLCIP
jgi:hypothetical protein